MDLGEFYTGDAEVRIAHPIPAVRHALVVAGKGKDLLKLVQIALDGALGRREALLGE